MKARLHAISYLQCYTARVEAEGVRNDFYSIPLMGAAIAAVATVAANAGKDATVDAGLAGGAIALLQQYDHPDKDQDTDLLVVQGLECVIDDTHPVIFYHHLALARYVRAITAAELDVLEDADVQKILSSGGSANADVVKQQAAINAALTAARDTVTALRAEVKAQTLVGTTIYTVTDQLDYLSRTNTKRRQNFKDAVGILNGAISAAGADQASTQTAKNATTDAQTAVKVAQTTSNPPGITTTKAKPSEKIKDANKTPAQTPAAADAAATPPAAPPPTDPATPPAPPVQGAAAPPAPPPAPAPAVTPPATPAANSAGDAGGAGGARGAADGGKPAAGAGAADGSDTVVQTPDEKAQYEIDAVANSKIPVVTRLILISEQGLDAIPTPSYSRINTDVAACFTAAVGGK